MKTKALTEPLVRKTRQKAIREKCLDCCADSSNEVARCQIRNCPLWIYRRGYEVDFKDRRLSKVAKEQEATD